MKKCTIIVHIIHFFIDLIGDYLKMTYICSEQALIIKINTLIYER